MRVANGPRAERPSEGRAQLAARRRHVRRPRSLAPQKHGSPTHRQEEAARAGPDDCPRVQSCHSDPTAASSRPPLSTLVSARLMKPDPTAPTDNLRCTGGRKHSRRRDFRLTSALRLETAVGGQVIFAQRGPVALLRPAARFGSPRLGGWRLCYLSAVSGSHAGLGRCQRPGR